MKLKIRHYTIGPCYGGWQILKKGSNAPWYYATLEQAVEDLFDEEGRKEFGKAKDIEDVIKRWEELQAELSAELKKIIV